jgi:hypothetical protein
LSPSAFDRIEDDRSKGYRKNTLASTPPNNTASTTTTTNNNNIVTMSVWFGHFKRQRFVYFEMQQAYGTLSGNNDEAVTKSSPDRGGRMSIMGKVLANTKGKDSERTKSTLLDSGIVLPPPPPTGAPATVSTPNNKFTKSMGSLFAAADDSLMSPTAMLHAGEGLNTNFSIPPYSPGLFSVNSSTRSNRFPSGHY